MEMSEFLEEFLKSYSELLDNYIDILFKIKDNPENQENINELFRVAHSIKGMAATMEFNKLEKAVHKLEDLLYEIRDGKIRLNEEMLSIISDGYVVLNEFLGLISECGSDEDADDKSVNRLVARISEHVSKEVKETVDIEGLYEVSNDNLYLFRNGAEPKNIIEFTVDSKSEFRCVRAFIAIKNISEITDILFTIPDRELIQNNMVDFDNVFVVTSGKPDLKRLLKHIDAAGEITSVDVFEEITESDMKQLIKRKPREVAGNSSQEYKELYIDDDFRGELSKEIAEICNDIEKELINLGYDFTNTGIADSIKERVTEMSEVAEYLKNENIENIIGKMQKLMQKSEYLFEEENSEYIDHIIDGVLLIKRIVSNSTIIYNEHGQSIIDDYLARAEKALQRHKVDDEKIGAMLQKELNLSDAELQRLIELQKEKYPELKLGEIAVIENKATTKDVLEMLRKQKKQTKKDVAADSYEHIKIKASKADDLLDLIEEVLTTQANLQKKMKKIEYTGDIINELVKLESIIRGIQGISISFRMVSLKTVFQNLRMTFKDTVKKLNKTAKLEIEGEETEIDRLIANRLYEPMLHIVKNAVSHGIEESDIRLANGKDKDGKVKITARVDKGYAIIEISDDGGGIPLDKVYKKALEKNIIDPKKQYTDDEIINFIFLPGFSTVESVNEISGRGVGMDVVRTEIAKLGGKLFIESVAGQGSRFTMKVPKNMTALNGTVIEASGEKYVIPTFYIKEIYVPEEKDFVTIAGEDKCIRFRDKIIPYIDYKKVYESAVAEHKIILILENDNVLKAMPVAKIHERRDIVVKSFGSDMEDVDFIFGATVLEDGNPVIILNIESLFK